MMFILASLEWDGVGEVKKRLDLFRNESIGVVGEIWKVPNLESTMKEIFIVLKTAFLSKRKVTFQINPKVVEKRDHFDNEGNEE